MAEKCLPRMYTLLNNYVNNSVVYKGGGGWMLYAFIYNSALDSVSHFAIICLKLLHNKVCAKYLFQR